MKKLKLETAEGQSTEVITKTQNNESYGLKKKKNKNKFKIQDSEVSTTSAIKEETLIPADEIKTEEGTDAKTNSKFSILWLNYKPRSTTLVKTSENWFDQLTKEKAGGARVDATTVNELKLLGQKILQQDVNNYDKAEQRGVQKEDLKFRKTVYSVGTTKDKLAAHVLRCMESPVHSVSHFHSVIGMISPKNKNETDEAIDSVFQLLDSTFLPDNRVARKFESHQFLSLLPLVASGREKADKQLALWYFEDQLYYAYRRFVSQLAKVCSDTVDKTKMDGIKSLIKLVKSRPGQDAELVIETVVNKLGDPSRKVASQTMHSLGTLMSTCSQLKTSVVTHVEMLLYRPNVTPKTQYYCLCYLKDILFKRSEYTLAAKMIKLYIGFFKACTKKGEVDTRLMGALLRGINRAFPFSRLQGEALHEQLETLYKLCHFVHFNISTQALQLIYQVVTSKDHVEDRFYQALYRQILDPAFGSSTGNTALLNLVFKAMMRDDSIERRQAFIKRLLQVGQYQSPHLMCGILFLVSEIIREKPEMLAATEAVLKSHVAEDDPDDDFEKFEDAEEVEDKPETMVINDLKEEPEDSKEDVINIAYDTEDLKPLDVPVVIPAVSSWFHHCNTNIAKNIKRNFYDPYLRNPQYCGAHYSPLWELKFLKEHYHPSVAVFADKIVSGKVIDYSGDPLQDFTLLRFLDRFVYKNPKKEAEKRESTSAAVLGSRAQYCPEGVRALAVNTQEFINLDSDKVPEDQKFFHSYFTKFGAGIKKSKKDDDEESIGDDEFEEYMKKLGGDGDGDGGDEPDEMDLDFAAGATGSLKGEGGDQESDEEGGGSEYDEPDFEGNSDEDASGDQLSDEEDDIDFDEENAAFSDGDNDDSMPPMKSTGKKKKKKKGTGSLESMFASADDFAHLLEENADEDTGLPPITSKAFANKDRANAKQLRWEGDRNDKISERGRFGNHGKKNARVQNRKFNKFGGHTKFKHSASQKKNSKGRGFSKPKRGRK